MNLVLRNALVKCAARKPGESVTLSDDEIRELLADQMKLGAEEALEGVTTVAFGRLRDEKAHLEAEYRVQFDRATASEGRHRANLNAIHNALGLRPKQHNDAEALFSCIYDAALDIRGDRSALQGKLADLISASRSVVAKQEQVQSALFEQEIALLADALKLAEGD